MLGAKLKMHIDTWWDGKVRPSYVEPGRFDLVAHSTGGLIARQYVADTGTANKLHNVVLVAIPHQGATMAYSAWEGQAMPIQPTSDALSSAPGPVTYLLFQALAQVSGCYDVKISSFGSGIDVTGSQLYRYVHGMDCLTTARIGSTSSIIATIPQPGIPLTADLLPSTVAQASRPYLLRNGTPDVYEPSSPVLDQAGGIANQATLNAFVNNVTDDGGHLFTVFSTNRETIQHYVVNPYLSEAPRWLNGTAVPGVPTWYGRPPRPDGRESDAEKGLEYSDDPLLQYGGDGTVAEWSGNLQLAITDPVIQNHIDVLQFPDADSSIDPPSLTRAPITHNDFFNTEVSMRRIAARFVAPDQDDTFLSATLAPRLPYVAPVLPNKETEVSRQVKFLLLNLCPVTVLVTDPQGRRIGTLPDGTTVNEIPGAYYSGHGGDNEPDIIHFSQPYTGTYTYTLTGVQAGEYNVYSTVVDQDQLDRLGYFSGSVQPGQIITYTAELTDQSIPDPVLLIDANGNSATVQHYTDTLTALGRSATVWSIANQGLPTLDQLYRTDTLIWLGSDTTGMNDETAQLLSWYVNQGGKLLLAGQNTTSGIQSTAVLSDALHAQVLNAASSSRQISGQGPLAGLQFVMNGDTSANNQTSPDSLASVVGAGTLATYTDGNGTNTAAILAYQSALGRMALLGFGLEGVDSAAHRSALLDRLLNWLATGETPTTTLSTRPWISATNGWGPVEIDQANGEELANDGGTLTLNGVHYTHGLGVHANSTIVYDLAGACSSFQADLGVDDEVSGSLPSLIFQVQLDGTTLYTSPTMTATSTTQQISLDVTGGHMLRLIVTDAGDGPSEDHADWADAQITCAASPAVQYLSDRPWVSATNGWGPVELDASNGEELAHDGGPININGVIYPKGLGTHANATIVYDLNGACTRFAADLGVDDEISGNLASVVFSITGDGTVRYTSGTITPSSPTTSVSIDVTGVDQLTLTVSDAGDGSGEDHADWAGARVTCTNGTLP